MLNKYEKVWLVEKIEQVKNQKIYKVHLKFKTKSNNFEDYHRACNDIPNLLTLIKVKDG